ncbi:MAG: hypothetical protein M1824_000556 [Vezdaea acicularis]|nr:MAG: hypothetical protein M1824_000556 [Vezdaea acicularis]
MASSKKRSYGELLEADLETSQLNEQPVTEGQAESENVAPAENDGNMEDLGGDWQVVESRRRKRNKKNHNKEGNDEAKLTRVGPINSVHEHQEHTKKGAGKHAENKNQASARQVVGSTTPKEGATRKKVPKTESSNYPSINFKNPNRLQSQLKVGQLQELVLNILADGPAPQWIEIAHKSQIRRVVVLMVHGLEREIFEGDNKLEESLKMHVDASVKSINVSKEGIDSPLLKEDLPLKEVDQLVEGETESGNGASELQSKDSSPAKAGQLAESKTKENGRSSPSNQDTKSPDFYIPTQLLKEKLALPLRPLADMFPLMWPVITRAWRNREQKLTSIQPPIEMMLKTVIPRSGDKKKAKNGPQPPREEASWINQPTPVTHFLVSPEELRQDGCAIHPAMFRNGEGRRLNLESRKQLQQTEEYGWMDTEVERWDSGDAHVQKGQEDSTLAGEDSHGKENGMQLDHPALLGEDENRDAQQLHSQKDSLLADREVFAIDCEMCMTGPEEFAVTRVSVVSWSGEVILDDLVKPEKPIIDYVTE